MTLIGKYLLCACMVTWSAVSCSQPRDTDQNSGNPGTRTGQFRLEKIVDGLTSPLTFAHPGDGSGRVFVTEQPGRIMIVKNGKIQPQPFLDIRSRVVKLSENYSEMGLLGLAFHPDYRNNGRFFVYYSAPTQKKGLNHESVIAEYKVSPGNADVAAMTEKVLMRIEQPESNHNGGDMTFGKDGYLYVALGDGGGAGDKHGKTGNGQNLNTLLGKIIRIDVDKGDPYGIPADNPFINKEGRDEIWAYGLRNPWRISFDRQTGQLFAGDVGQNEYEEVSIIEKGQNYGWRAMEATHVYDKSLNEGAGKTVLPINEYPHSVGNSITGGYVYRGKQHPGMQGKYFFADWSGRLFYLEKTGNGWKRQDCNVDGDNKVAFRINSFGEDEAGEIYVLTQSEVGAVSPTGTLYRLVPDAANGGTSGK